jgi:glycosyltransferase involved in cell wall biosynthesis
MRHFRDLLRRARIQASEKIVEADVVSPQAVAIGDLDAKIEEIETKLKNLAEHRRGRTAHNKAVIRRLRAEVRYREALGRSVLPKFALPERFADECARHEHKIKADAYICKDLETLLAADALRANAGLVILDRVEALSLRGRSTRNASGLDPWTHALDRANAGLLSIPNVAMAASPGICRELNDAGLRTVYIPSYPASRALADRPGIREACGLAPAAKLALVPGDIDPSLDLATILEAFTHLPENYHLATAGEIRPESERARLLGVVDDCALQGRVHILAAVEREAYSAFARGADVAVTAQDRRNASPCSAVPDAVFDCVAAGLPVAADLPDIEEILSGYGTAGRFERASPASIAATIEALAERKGEIAESLGRAARDFVWSANEALIVDLVGASETVTILGIGDLASDTRTCNIAATLIRHGIGVTVFTSEAPNGERRDGRLDRAVPGVKYLWAEA